MQIFDALAPVWGGAAAGRVPASDQHSATGLETARPGAVSRHRAGDARGNLTPFYFAVAML